MHGAGGTKLLSYDDAAEALGVSRNTVKALVAAGKLPIVDLGRKTKRIREADLEALINAKTHYVVAKSA